MIFFAWSMNASSPSLSEIEFTTGLPCTHCKPASITSHFDESIINGTREMSGSDAIKFRKRTIAAFESNIASSMLMSMICAPFSTCWRATDNASSNWLFKIMRAKAFEPVTLVRSPTLTNRDASLTTKGSRPERRRLRFVLLINFFAVGVGGVGCHKYLLCLTPWLSHYPVLRRVVQCGLLVVSYMLNVNPNC